MVIPSEYIQIISAGIYAMNWLSFMINEKVISDKKMTEHIKPIIARYYEDTFLKNASVDEKDSESYQQFKKLYRTIKK